MQRRARRAGVAASLALAMAVGGAPATAFSGPGADWGSLVEAADAARDGNRPVEAADGYRRAYDVMPAGDRVTFGTITALNAAASYKEAFAGDGNLAHMKASRELLWLLVADIEARGEPIPEDVAAELARVDGLIANVEGSRPQDDPVAEPPEPEPEPEPTPARPVDMPVLEPDRDRGGIAMVVIGPIAIVGGAVMIALGAPLGRDAKALRDERLPIDRMSERYVDATPEQQQAYEDGWTDYVDARTAQTTALVSVGAILATAGIVLTTIGAVRLARHRRGPRQVARIQPTGLGLGARF